MVLNDSGKIDDYSVAKKGDIALTFSGNKYVFSGPMWLNVETGAEAIIPFEAVKEFVRKGKVIFRYEEVES